MDDRDEIIARLDKAADHRARPVPTADPERVMLKISAVLALGDVAEAFRRAVPVPLAPSSIGSSALMPGLQDLLSDPGAPDTSD